ncbi:MAG: efflux RND transporter permease subunit [Clostridium butyricum]|nr:efflux RND transporter permease subunit [Clostridium butyricum]
MNLTKTSVKRPLTILMIFLIVIMFGGIGYKKMPQNLMPDIDMPFVLVQTTWVGAGPEDVDEQISKKIEEQLSSVSNVKMTVSQSLEGYSMVGAQFEYGTDLDEILNDVRSKVDSVQSSLPDDVKKSTVSKMDMNQEAIASIVVGGNSDPDAIIKYAEDVIQPKIESVDGVTSAEIRGGDKSQINIVADPVVLSSYGVTLDTIKSILSASNKTMPYGTITQGEDKITLRGIDKLESLEDVKNIQIPLGQTGQTIRLDKVCDVQYGKAEKTAIYRYNGKETVLLAIQKQQDANVVQVMQKVKNTVDELNKENSAFKLEVINDESTYIVSSINDVIKNLGISSVIAFIVIFAFLKSFRASFVVAVAIPTSIIGAIALLYFTGETINVVTLSSLVIAVGMVVDNGTVVIENIFKYRKNPNLDLEDATIDGTKTVTNAIIASTLTTVAIFLPILFTEGFTMIMFGALAKTLIFALSLSLIVAITLVPSVFAKLSGGKNGSKLIEKPSPIFDKVSEIYQKLINVALKHKIVVIVTSIAMLFGSLAIVATGAIGMEFMNSGDEGKLSISIKLPDGLDLEPSNYYVSMVEEKISDIPEIKSVMTNFFSGNKKANIELELVSTDERKKTTEDIEKEIDKLVKTVPDCEISVSANNSVSGNGTGDVSIKLFGENLDVLEEICNQAETKLKKLDGFRNVSSTLSDASKEAQFKIDKKKAQEYGVNTAGIAGMLRLAINGDNVTTATIDDYKLDVNLRLKDTSVDNLEDIKQLKVQSTKGQQVPIGAFAEIKIADGLKAVSKSDGKYSVTVSAKVDGKDLNTANKEAMAAINEIDMPKDYGQEVSGEAKMMNEAMEGLVFSMIIAIILVYMVMVAQFESFNKPFIIMFSIPFAFVGVVLALLVSRISLNVVGMLGAILLVGIVVNNGIVLIDYIGQLRESRLAQEISLEDLVAKGCATRLRPVLMTTATTIVGMIPTALGFGDSGAMMQPLGVVIIGGLTVSTLVTLVLIPTVYLIFERIGNKFSGKLKKVSGNIVNKFSRKNNKIEAKTISSNVDSNDKNNKIQDK